MDDDDLQESGKEGFSAARAVAAPVATLALACAGFYMFAKDWSYFENGQMGLIACFLAGLVGFFFAFSRKKMALAILAVALCGLSVFASQKKYEWRRNYIESGRSGVPFPLEPYIDRYPPYEEYLLAPWLGTPDWVRFSRECIEPVLKEEEPGKSCGNLGAIRQKYNIDVMAALNSYRNKMAQTAKKIADGKLTKKIDYMNCLSSRQCAEVPLLPPGVDADALDPESDDFIRIRRPFWQLVNDKTITPEICVYMNLCRVLGKTGAVSLDQDVVSVTNPALPGKAPPPPASVSIPGLKK